MLDAIDPALSRGMLAALGGHGRGDLTVVSETNFPAYRLGVSVVGRQGLVALIAPAANRAAAQHELRRAVRVRATCVEYLERSIQWRTS